MSTPSPSTRPDTAPPGPVRAGAARRGRPSIAIVAVHRVADQQPHESAGAIANLLLRIRRKGASAYTSFRELPLRIPTAPVRLREGEGPAEAPRPGFSMEERPAYLRARMAAPPRQPPRGAAPPEAPPGTAHREPMPAKTRCRRTTSSCARCW
jgi:hypothetical protein